MSPLDSDFEGYGQLQQMLAKVPKFGNDDADADEQVAWVLHQWVDEFTKVKNLRGGHCSPGGSPMFSYIPQGKAVGALPSGRRAGEPLAMALHPAPVRI